MIKIKVVHIRCGVKARIKENTFVMRYCDILKKTRLELKAILERENVFCQEDAIIYKLRTAAKTLMDNQKSTKLES